MKDRPFQGSGPAFQAMVAGTIRFFGYTELLMKKGDFRPLLMQWVYNRYYRQSVY